MYNKGEERNANKQISTQVIMAITSKAYPPADDGYLCMYDKRMPAESEQLLLDRRQKLHKHQCHAQLRKLLTMLRLEVQNESNVLKVVS